MDERIPFIIDCLLIAVLKKNLQGIIYSGVKQIGECYWRNSSLVKFHIQAEKTFHSTRVHSLRFKVLPNAQRGTVLQASGE